MAYMAVFCASTPQYPFQSTLRSSGLVMRFLYGESTVTAACGVPSTRTDALSAPLVEIESEKPVAHTVLSRSPAPRKLIQSTDRRRRRPVAAGASPVALWVIRELSTAPESAAHLLT